MWDVGSLTICNMQNVCWQIVPSRVCVYVRCLPSEFSLVSCVHLHFSVLRISNFICFDVWCQMRWVRTRLLMHWLWFYSIFCAMKNICLSLSVGTVGCRTHTIFPSLNIWTLIEWTRALLELMCGVDFSAHHFTKFGASAKVCILIQSNDGSLSHLITA